MNKKGFGRGALGGMIRHYKREIDPVTGEYQQCPREHGGGNIDPSRTHLNFTLGECHDMEWIHDRLEGVYQRPQDLRNGCPVMVDVVITLPDGEDVSPENVNRFMQAAHRSLCRQFGRENNIVGAWCHLDEATPHMHFSFLPIVPKQLKGNRQVKEAVSVKKYFPTKSSLRQMHAVTQKDISKELGRRVELLNGNTIAGNKSIRQLKKETRRHIRNAKAVDKSINDICDKVSTIPLTDLYAIPKEDFDKLVTMAEVGMAAVKSHDDFDEAKRNSLQLHDAIDRKNRELEESQDELKRVIAEAEPFLSVPEHLRDVVDQDIEYRRNEYRDCADSVNRTVCKLFLDSNRDFRATVKAAGPMLESIGIPKDRHSDYVKSCLSAVVKQAKARHRHQTNPQKEYSPPVRGRRWNPNPRETDYDKPEEPRHPLAPPPTQDKIMALDARLGEGDMLSIDKDWNLMTVFEKEELETKAMLREL